MVVLVVTLPTTAIRPCLPHKQPYYHFQMFRKRIVSYHNQFPHLLQSYIRHLTPRDKQLSVLLRHRNHRLHFPRLRNSLSRTILGRALWQFSFVPARWRETQILRLLVARSIHRSIYMAEST